MAAIARETLEVILAHVRARLSPLAIYVFGSQATAQAQPGSDLDIAVLGPAPYDPWTLFMLSEELVSLQEQYPQNGPPSELDLLDLNAVPPTMQVSIVTQGRRVFCANRLRCDLFEIRVLKEYCYLQDERRSILEDIRRRGRIYG